MDPREVRHLPVLDAVNGAGNVSQRRLAEELQMAVSQVNRLIRELLDAGYLELVDSGVRPFAYRLTEAGERYLRRLHLDHYRAVVIRFRELQSRIRERLSGFRDDGVQRMVLYGTGEVMEVALPLAEDLGFEVVGLVDDDPDKQGRHRAGRLVSVPGTIFELEPDGVLITTIKHAEEIRDRIESRLPSSVHLLDL